jgi:hypothetical protein
MGIRRKFTDEFKREAVRLVSQPGNTLLGGIDQSWHRPQRPEALGRQDQGRPLRANAEQAAQEREPIRTRGGQTRARPGEDGAGHPKERALGYFAKAPT